MNNRYGTTRPAPRPFDVRAALADGSEILITADTLLDAAVRVMYMADRPIQSLTAIRRENRRKEAVT